jgi:Lysylphosphatidylglycerol synthase TM region
MQIVFRAVSVAAGGALLILVFRNVNFSAMYSRIANVGYYFIPIYAVYGIGCLLDTAAWKVILTTPSKTISFSKLFQIHIAGESMYRFIPAGVVVGEAAKVFLLTKQSRFNGPEAISSLVIRKLLMGLSQGLYIGLGVFLGILLSRVSVFVQLVSVGISLLVIGVFLAIGIKLSRGSLFNWLFRFLRKMPFVGTKVEKNKVFFEQTDFELKFFFVQKRRQGVLAFLLFFGGWLTEAFETYLIIAVLGIQVLAYQVMIFEPMVSLTRSLAFFIPGGLGVMDSGYVSAFGSAGIANVVTAGAAFIVIKRSKELFWIVVGLLFMWLQGRTVAKSMLGQQLQPDIVPEIV